MKISSTLLSIFLLFVYSISKSQSVKDEVVEYNYVKLPLQPINKSITNYTSLIFATYETQNAEKKAKHEADKKIAQDEFDKETAAYPAKVKAAEDKYNAELEEYNKQGLAEKVIEDKVLGESNKPVKQTPSPPYLRGIPEPDLQTTYDYPVVANTYLNLGGFSNNVDNAVNIKVTIYGFDYTQPRQMTTQKEMSSYVNGQTTKRMVTYYYTEFSYRHPMAVQVTLPDGTVILNETPQELNTYIIYKSPETETSSGINTDLLIKTYEEKVFQNNLIMLNNLVNDKFGFQKVKRLAKLYFVKAKDETYQDLLIAFNDASAGLKLLVDEEIGAKIKLENAVKLWTAALAESDATNNKARIDKNVTNMLCLNLLEVYFALKNPTEAEKIIAKMNMLNLSAEEKKQKEDFELLFIDLKKRMLANN